jgi:hypothetical protein
MNQLIEHNGQVFSPNGKVALENCLDLTPEELRAEVEKRTREQSELEVAWWKECKPQKHLAYVKRLGVNDNRGILTTWLGDELGTIRFGRKYRCLFGDTRVSIDVEGNNGISYYGTYYESSGDIARIYRRKTKKR